MAVEACVKAILCPLGNAVLSGIKAIIDTQLVALQAQVTAITATLTVVQIQLLPFQAARAAVDLALTPIEEAANLIPVKLMNGCFGLGLSMKDISDSFASVEATANNVLADINRRLSYAAFLEAQRDAINEAIDRLRALSEAIGECS